MLSGRCYLPASRDRDYYPLARDGRITLTGKDYGWTGPNRSSGDLSWQTANPESPAPVDLVLQGAGVKGIAVAGAVDELLTQYHVQRVAGVSSGAILACLLAAGWQRDELRDAITSFRYADKRPAIPLLSPLLRLFTKGGLDSGDYIEHWVEEKLAEKGVHSFADLRSPLDPDADRLLQEGDRNYRLVLTATDITHGRSLRLPWDYRDAFGLDPDEQSVARAVRMALSIPLFFTPCKLTDARTGKPSTIVDGGVLSKCPVEIFDRHDGRAPRWPTFGVGITPGIPSNDGTLAPGLPTRLARPIELLEATVATSIVGNDQTHLDQPRNAARVIRAETESIGIVDFGLGASERASLFTNGQMAAREFLETWNWADYLERYYPTPT